MTHHLSFEVEYSREAIEPDFNEAEPATVRLVADVTALCNGQAICPGGLFDTFSVLARGPRPSEFDPYTCSCGVAGCAGFHESVQLEASATEVSWTFPENPYRRRLNPLLREEQMPLVLTFERAQYEAALAQLEAALRAKERESDVPLLIAPYHSDDPSFDELLPLCRKNVHRWIDEQEERVALFGALSDEALAVEFPDARCYHVPLVTLAQSVAYVRATLHDTLSDEELAPVVAQLKSAAEAACVLARELPWSELDPSAYRVSGDFSVESVESEEAREACWQAARLTVVPAGTNR